MSIYESLDGSSLVKKIVVGNIIYIYIQTSETTEGNISDISI